MEYPSSVYSDILLIGRSLKELEIAKDLDKIIPVDENYRKILAEVSRCGESFGIRISKCGEEHGNCYGVSGRCLG